MALILGLKKGCSMYIGDTRVTLHTIIGPEAFRIQVFQNKKKPHYLPITGEESTEILPSVFVSAGNGDLETARVVVDAPRSITILREGPYKRHINGQTSKLPLHE
jgi:sRNA-binding carbon storage regulator CsrA